MRNPIPCPIGGSRWNHATIRLASHINITGEKLLSEALGSEPKPLVIDFSDPNRKHALRLNATVGIGPFQNSAGRF